MKKKLILLSLCLLLLCSPIAALADVGCCIINFNKNYTLSGNGPTDIVRVAEVQLDKTRSSFGYRGYWCAAFVNDCAMLAGQSSAIPFKTGLTHDCTKLLAAVTESGGQLIYDGPVVSSVSGAKAGDLIFYSELGNSNYGHVGIMLDSSNTIEGNMGDQVKYASTTNHSTSYSQITVVRPAYGVSYPCSPDPDTVNFAAIHVRNITNTSAQINASVAEYHNALSNHGYRLGTSPTNIIVDHAYNQYAYDSAFFFNLSNLSPGTTYYYQMWYLCNGVTYTSSWHTFTTTGTVAVTGVTLSPSSASLETGESVTLTASVSPSNATNKSVSWASSNTAVATVSGGVVKAVAPGTAVITATASNGVSASASITVSAPTHSLLSISCLIGGEAASGAMPGVFDLYIDDELVAQGVSSYSAQAPIGASYAVRNIMAHAGYKAETTSVIGTIVANHPAIHLDFTENDTWIYADTLPDGITSDLYHIEYRSVEQTNATTSPGSDWVQGDIVNTSYTASGAPYESDLPLDTSDTRRLTNWYYFHWCGTSSIAAEHYATDKYFHFDSIPDSSKVTVVSTATDQLDSRYVYYDLNWLDGSKAYCKTGITCDSTYGTHAERSYYWYKMYVYQDYTAVHTYSYTRDTGWIDVEPAQYTQVRYSPKQSQAVSVTLNMHAASGLPGDIFPLEAIVSPEDAASSVLVWSSSDSAVAEVDEGVVTLVQPGYAVISCAVAGQPDTAAQCHVVVHAMQQLVLPASVKRIDSEAFSDVPAVEIVIPDGTESIGSRAFSGCENLILISIPDSVSSIADDAFDEATPVLILCSDESFASQYADKLGISHLAE